jgi:hypothetical protein
MVTYGGRRGWAKRHRREPAVLNLERAPTLIA